VDTRVSHSAHSRNTTAAMVTRRARWTGTSAGLEPLVGRILLTASTRTAVGRTGVRSEGGSRAGTTQSAPPALNHSVQENIDILRAESAFPGRRRPTHTPLKTGNAHLARSSPAAELAASSSPTRSTRPTPRTAPPRVAQARALLTRGRRKAPGNPREPSQSRVADAERPVTAVQKAVVGGPNRPVVGDFFACRDCITNHECPRSRGGRSTIWMTEIVVSRGVLSGRGRRSA
jgi:hypothetical protein